MKWNIRSEYRDGESVVSLITKIRGVSGDPDFLNPPSLSEAFKKIPADLKESLLRARDIINESVLKNNKILIHGDYDADGISATSILFNTLSKELGYQNVFHFIPNRFDHGYGVSKNSILAFFEKIGQKIDDKEKILVITVDCGITAVKEIEFLKENGHSVIITDHHQKGEALPPADVIVWYDKVVGAPLS